VRLADRGALAALILPAGYVAVPYLSGLLAARTSITVADIALMAALYAGFVGRILLKDFRDVRGDALFGKRTFLVRHGRAATCWFSGLFMFTGTAVLVVVRDVTPVLVGVYVSYLVLTLLLLRALATSASARRDEALISAIAIVGRAMIVTLYGHFEAR
jgi:4-hydroxybenzoate polyprenyltransferase